MRNKAFWKRDGRNSELKFHNGFQKFLHIVNSWLLIEQKDSNPLNSKNVPTLKSRTRSQRGCSIWWLVQDNYLHQVGKENLQGLPKEELPDTHTVGILGKIKVTVLVRLCAVKLEQWKLSTYLWGRCLKTLSVYL